jgi:hypothetical protein
MKRTLIALAVTLAALPVAALAHHSFAAEYDSSKPMTLIGVINKVDQQNPHGFIYMNVTSATNGRVTNRSLSKPMPPGMARNGPLRKPSPAPTAARSSRSVWVVLAVTSDVHRKAAP